VVLISGRAWVEIARFPIFDSVLRASFVCTSALPWHAACEELVTTLKKQQTRTVDFFNRLKVCTVRLGSSFVDPSPLWRGLCTVCTLQVTHTLAPPPSPSAARTLKSQPHFPWACIQKNKRGKVDRKVFATGAAKLGLKGGAALLFDAMDSDNDGAVSLADFNAATKAFARGEAMPGADGTGGAVGGGAQAAPAASRDTTPSKRPPQRRCGAHGAGPPNSRRLPWVHLSPKSLV